MKVLLIGEYSGFHRNLKAGLKELGVEAIVAGSHDGYKNLHVDIELYRSNPKNNTLSFLNKQIQIYLKTKKLKNFDLVQFINPFLFLNRFKLYALAYNRLIYENLEKQNKNVFLSSCGNDAVYVQIGKNKMDYNGYDPDITENRSIIKESKDALNWNLQLIEKSKGIIPIGYEYWVGYNEIMPESDKLSPVIPPMIASNEFQFEELQIGSKLKLFHGINKAKAKGSPMIIEAMNEIKHKYPNDIELLIYERLPYNEYTIKMKEAHVNIDQTNSYAYGINALISMAMGKITLSGAEPVAIEALGMNDCPVINIKPDSEHIYRQLCMLLERKHELQIIGEKSRICIEEYHDAKIIARKYLDFWKSKFE